jgi:hypothetical protein
MVTLNASPSKVSDYPALAATLERYKTLDKKKRGRPKKVSTALKADLKVAMPSLLLNPNCDLGLFWDVFHEAAAEEYRASLPSRFNEWQQAVDRIERAAEQKRNATIKLANQQYENTLAQEVQPAQAELDQMKHLADAVDNMLPKEKLAEFFRQVAKQKAKGGHWRKKLPCANNKRATQQRGALRDTLMSPLPSVSRPPARALPCGNQNRTLLRQPSTSWSSVTNGGLRRP